MKLSVILPAYNSAGQVRNSLEELERFLQPYQESFEIIVVDDGSSDDTSAQVAAFNSPRVRLIRHERNLGKFAAVKSGMLTAQGTCCIFTDVDLPYDLAAIPYIERITTERGFHIAIGDRTLVESRSDKPVGLTRRFFTQACRAFVRIFVTGEIFDTQCGLKGFRRDVARALFPLLRETRFAGDIELIYIALKYNLEIKRIPVRLRRMSPSTIRFLPDILAIVRRVFLLWWAWKRGWYLSSSLQAIARQTY